jgi:pilus assembly protein CpaC
LKRRRPSLLALVAASAVSLAVNVMMIAEAQAEKLIQIGAQKRTATVQVFIGKSEDVRTDTSFVEITVGDPEVADVHPLTDRALSILGKKNGTTRVSVYAEGKKLIGVFDVEVVYDTSLIQSEINRRFPYAKVKVTSVNGRIMISGETPDGPTLDRIVQIARQFGPDIINTVQVSSPQQVMLEVRFVEATRQASRELGVQWNRVGDSSLVNIGDRVAANQLPVTRDVAAGVLSGTAPFGFMIARLVASGVDTQLAINALEQRGLARSLAEPNLVALSGDTASFLAGGEFPVPVPGVLGQVSIEYKRYGVGLAFTPTVLGGGLINMKIEPEVSQLDTSHPVLVAGVSIPPLIVRRASTTVELRDGQSFVIGGLLQSNGKNSLQQLPWIGDVPVLGALFRSASYQKDETDLAIIVTPRLVRPARPGDVIKTPLETSLPANDPDLFLLGKTEMTPATARLLSGVPPREFTGHVLDLPKGAARAFSAKN